MNYRILTGTNEAEFSTAANSILQIIAFVSQDKVAIGRSGVDGLGSFERTNTQSPVGCCCYQALEGVYDSGGDISNAGVVYCGFLRYPP
jgi:hypothetical protein